MRFYGKNHFQCIFKEKSFPVQFYSKIIPLVYINYLLAHSWIVSNIQI